MEQWLQTLWYGGSPPSKWLLPLSGLYGAVVALQRYMFRQGWRSRHRLPVPVVVVGNITVGGTGKTPLTLALVQALQARGWRPGIISRGYGALSGAVHPVAVDEDPARVGDEPALMAGRSGVPVWVGRDRCTAGRSLLQAHPDVDVLVSDDGLQHWALKPDVEIVVVDGERLFGNGALLPAGPLREPKKRLESVDAVVFNGPQPDWALRPRQFAMTLHPVHWVHVNDATRTLPLAHFRGQTGHAVAGIGHPERFFRLLQSLGIAVIPHAFPDHHRYGAGDFELDSPSLVLMTEKDAIKCRNLLLPQGWALRVEASCDPGLAVWLDQVLQGRKHGQTAA